MKIIAKTKAILISNLAETMVEVIVAFVVLSIVMVLFAQGIRFANAAEYYAIENSKACDKAMVNLQKTVTGHGSETDMNVVSTNSENQTLDGKSDMLKITKYTITNTSGGDYNIYTYWVFDANLGQGNA